MEKRTPITLDALEELPRNLTRNEEDPDFGVLDHDGPLEIAEAPESDPYNRVGPRSD